MNRLGAFTHSRTKGRPTDTRKGTEREKGENAKNMDGGTNPHLKMIGS